MYHGGRIGPEGQVEVLSPEELQPFWQARQSKRVCYTTQEEMVSRRVYISCDVPERSLLEVRALHDFLQANSCLVDYSSGPHFGRHVRDVVHRCDAFVAVFAGGYSISVAMVGELLYAHALKEVRGCGGRPRPRLFGLRVSGYDVLCPDVSLKWLDSQPAWNSLLEDEL